MKQFTLQVLACHTPASGAPADCGGICYEFHITYNKISYNISTKLNFNNYEILITCFLLVSASEFIIFGPIPTIGILSRSAHGQGKYLLFVLNCICL